MGICFAYYYKALLPPKRVQVSNPKREFDMLWIILVATVVVIVLIYVMKNRGSDEDFDELRKGFIRIQKNAFNNISVENGSSGISPPTSDQLNKQAFLTSNKFSVFYTISKDGNDQYNHVISGKPLRNTRQKAVIENMLLFMLVLSQQFEKTGFRDDVKFNIDASELGTHFIEFSLDLEQQEAFHRVVVGRSVSQKTSAQCPSCKAVYTINSSKIPERGVYTRCQKCQERFLIKRDNLLSSA